MIRRLRVLFVTLVALLTAPLPTAAQEVGGKVPLTHDVYDSWRSISGQALSDDGAWLLHAEVPQDFWADDINTPLMYMHNDQDDAVPWYQGIELIMALRRLGKEAQMFNYNGEAHGLRKRVNQEDWTVRMAEFFDHHLKGSPAPAWMTDGIRAWDKGEEKE